MNREQLVALGYRLRAETLSRLRRLQLWVDQLPLRASNATIQQLGLQMQYRQLAERSVGLPSINDTRWDRYTIGGEDGMLIYIFALIEFGNRRAIDLGGAGVRAANTMNLILHHDFDACVIDGNKRSISILESFFARHPATRERIYQPTCVAAWIDTETVGPLITDHGFRGKVDLLSVDLDGVDYWILDAALETIEPRVIVVEYQDHLGPDRAWTVPYRSDFNVADYPINAGGTYLYCGAGLRAYDKLLTPRGYQFVGCNRDGYNAFFVRSADAADRLPAADIESAFTSRWTQWGMQNRFPQVADMDWKEV
jgi:hypothetical protein